MRVCNDTALLLGGDNKLSVLQYGGQFVWKQVPSSKFLQYRKGGAGRGSKPRCGGVAFVKPAVEACYGGMETGGNVFHGAGGKFFWRRVLGIIILGIISVTRLF